MTEAAGDADSPAAAPPLESADSMASQSSAMSRWSSAGKRISMQLAIVNRFSLLRDRAGSSFIDPGQLSKVRVLGEGAFAKVELCRLGGADGKPGQEVAVKRLHANLFNSPQDVDDFVAEGVLLSSLDHPSIVSVRGLGFDAKDGGAAIKPESLFICFEVCRGGSLRDLVRRQMQNFSQVVYTYADGLRWAVQIASGLAYLHQGRHGEGGKERHKTIHRDVKLDNFLLTGDPKAWDVKITDFGLHAMVAAKDNTISTKSLQTMASSKEAEVKGPATPDSLLQRSQSEKSPVGRLKTFLGGGSKHRDTRMFELTGQTGSFLSMAPEVVMGKPYNEACDVFSLGCCLFEIFAKAIAAADITYTGAPEEFQIYAMRVARGYRRPHPKHWGAALSSLVTDCMNQDPAARPTAAQVVERLAAIGDSGAIAVMDARGHGCCAIQ